MMLSLIVKQSRRSVMLKLPHPT